MADKSRILMRKKERKGKEVAELTKDVKEMNNEREKTGNDGEVTSAAAAVNKDAANSQDGDFQVESMELPPFEIVTG